MKKKYFIRFCLTLWLVLFQLSLTKGQHQWKIYIANDVCLDYTWALTEEQVHDYTAELIAAHLDAMKATDHESWENMDRYTCTTTNEILFFLEKYPERKEELVSRVKEGRITLSPFLVNTNWGFPGVEGFLRGLYPAKRFAIANNLKLEHAVHSELPSLPWGAVSLLAGSGIRWLNKPYLNYDATFASLENPPIFKLAGPDNSMLNVVMDKYASSQYCYMQGGGILKIFPYEKDTLTIEKFWLTHYSSLNNYPFNTILAEGTHCDLSVNSARQAFDISQKIIAYNSQPQKPVTLVNASFPMFTDLIDSIQLINPFMTSLKGGFGHSWELWPLALSKYAVNLRLGENRLVAAEALLSTAGIALDSRENLLEMHRRAEWLLAMLTDHAWNGSDTSNIKTNSRIRREYSEELLALTDSLIRIGFIVNGLSPQPGTVTLFNPTNYSRSSIVEIPVDNNHQMAAYFKNRPVTSQSITRNGRKFICFKPDTIPGYGFTGFELKPLSKAHKTEAVTRPCYKISLKNNTEITVTGLKSSAVLTTLKLKYKSDSVYYAEMMVPEIISDGPLATYYHIKGRLPHTDFVLELIIDKSSETIDFNVLIDKTVSRNKEGIYLICKLADKAKLEVETTAAVESPYLIPKGNFLAGADSTRMVVQGFVKAGYSDGSGVLLCTPDAFCLNPDDSEIVIQLLGNNNNYNEAVKDQNCETNFSFRFSLTPFNAGFTLGQAHRTGFLKQKPILYANGVISQKTSNISITNPEVKITAYKPADPQFGRGQILRIWNTSDQSQEVLIQMKNQKKAWATDLLEQDIIPLQINENRLVIAVKPFGFATIRLKN